MSWEEQDEESFEEYCSGCRKVKMVKTDLHSSYDNPAFICEECWEGRDEFHKRYSEMMRKKHEENNE